MTQVRVTFLGPVVGKTALIEHFVIGRFIQKYDPTIEDSFRKQCEVDGKVYMLDISDTSGLEEYSALRDSHAKCGESFVLVYSITSAASFKAVKEVYHALLRMKEKDYVPVVFKCDLEDMREVSMSEGEELARSWGVCFCLYLAPSILFAHGFAGSILRGFGKGANPCGRYLLSMCS